MRPSETQGSGQGSNSSESESDAVSCPQRVHSNRMSGTTEEEEQGKRVGLTVVELGRWTRSKVTKAT